MHNREQFYNVFYNCLLPLLISDEYLFNLHFVFAFLIFAQNQF